MSAPPAQFSAPAPKISQETFLGFVWGGFAVAACFVLFRAWARYHAFRRYFLDDCFVLLALIFLLISAIIWQRVGDYMYDTLYVAAGVKLPTSASFITNTETYLRSQIGIIILFMSSLWSIKIAFLLFFRRLGENVSGQQIHWWGTFAFTVATYFVGIGTIQYNCLAPSFITIATTCSGDSAKNFEHATLANNLAMDVASDLLIRIRIAQKLALGAIFCLVMITITIAIVRFAVVRKYAQPEQSWLYFWNTIENVIAIIIVCLASFRALFRRQEKHDQIPDNENLSQPSQSRRRLLGGLRSVPFWSGSWRSKGRSVAPNKPSMMTKQPSKTSQEQILPAGQIQVRSDFELSSYLNEGRMA